uniref:beta-galactoside alpha-(2,6)-sialyltransferase n=1 Tax=Tetraselmis sp. GSL018 TaxID=582737 RepID=A0A061RVY2_9CHLO
MRWLRTSRCLQRPRRLLSFPPSVRVDVPESEEVRPLPAKYQKLLEDLKNKQQPVLTLPRLRKSARISCGGSSTMRFRTWAELKSSSPLLNQTLPVRAFSLPDLAAAVAASPCFKGSKYKKPGCEFFVPAKESDQEPVCAVVGNSGRLRHQNWQNEIDSCDIVIRFNNGITQKFERNVGTKSTIRLFNGPYTNPKQPGEITIAELRDLAVRHWVKSWLKRPPGETLAFVMDPELICNAWEWVGRAGEKPSSGLVGIVLGLHLCRHVHVFGFSFDDYFDKTVRPHYYDWERPKPGREAVHPFSQEAQLYKILQEAGKITLHG